jgi:hypothetical protein
MSIVGTEVTGRAITPFQEKFLAHDFVMWRLHSPAGLEHEASRIGDT